MRRVRVDVDERRCVGSGTCVLIAPSLFSLDAGNTSVPPRDVVNADDALIEAVESCPTEALVAIDVDTGETVYPSW
jgi:ferredoxin